jgi:hypothetical protein
MAAEHVKPWKRVLGMTVEWEFTPFLGGVFGKAAGLAPGYKDSPSWWKLEFYSEGERVFVTVDSTRSFFCNWAQMTLTPRDRIGFGLVQRSWPT